MPGTEKGPLQVGAWLRERREGTKGLLGPRQLPWTGSEASPLELGSGFSFLVLERVSGESRSLS